MSFHQNSNEQLSEDIGHMISSFIIFLIKNYHLWCTFLIISSETALNQIKIAQEIVIKKGGDNPIIFNVIMLSLLALFSLRLIYIAIKTKIYNSNNLDKMWETFIELICILNVRFVALLMLTSLIGIDIILLKIIITFLIVIIIIRLLSSRKFIIFFILSTAIFYSTIIFLSLAVYRIILFISELYPIFTPKYPNDLGLGDCLIFSGCIACLYLAKHLYRKGIVKKIYKKIDALTIKILKKLNSFILTFLFKIRHIFANIDPKYFISTLLVESTLICFIPFLLYLVSFNEIIEFQREYLYYAGLDFSHGVESWYRISTDYFIAIPEDMKYGYDVIIYTATVLYIYPKYLKLTTPNSNRDEDLAENIEDITDIEVGMDELL